MQLSIKNLSKTYSNGVNALKNVSLEIGTGMFGLLGQNGAGKSTLMRTLATLQEADSGSAQLTGGDKTSINVLTESQRVRELLGYLPQEFGVYASVTAEEMLTHIADAKGISNVKERRVVVEALLQKVNLYDVRKKNLGSYSGGMKQRFGVAQALIGQPKLIIVDEPTAGLDPTERNRFYNLLSEIGENTIVILSTHIVEDVSTLCNDMAIIGNGEVLKTGKPADIEATMRGKVWETDIAKSELAVYQAKHTVISNRFHLGKLLITVISDTQPASSFSAKTPTLEDAYFSTIYRTGTASKAA
jgi:ABC-2 type transport system ATP-binding protein